MGTETPLSEIEGKPVEGNIRYTGRDFPRILASIFSRAVQRPIAFAQLVCTSCSLYFHACWCVEQMENAMQMPDNASMMELGFF